MKRITIAKMKFTVKLAMISERLQKIKRQGSD